MAGKYSDNVQMVLDVLRDEINGDVQEALAKLTDNYSMTWVYKAPKTGELFPCTSRNVRDELEEAYRIKGRSYEIKHVGEGRDVVFVEMVESYPDPVTGVMYRTPVVLVLELREGKIQTGRHYCDPALSYLQLSEAELKKVYK